MTSPSADPAADVVRGILPYSLEFVHQAPADPKVLPPLQAYQWAAFEDGSFFVLGGRIGQGLHGFSTVGNNFLPAKANPAIWRVVPETSSASVVLDLTGLPDELRLPLTGTDQQSYYDAATGNWFICGGYSYLSNSNSMTTFDTLVRIPLREVASAASDPSLTAEQRQAKVASLIGVARHPLLKVTGGSLHRLRSGLFALAFGQLFDGLYSPFAGGFVQEYIEAVRYFALDQKDLRLTNTGQVVSPDPDRPFHRRDGVVVDSAVPETGADGITAFGGAFRPGIIGAYDYPVHLRETRGMLSARSDRALKQRFAPYTCPTIVVFDARSGSVFHTFFGGIAHYWYWQTPAQHQVYTGVTKVGRNDGLPFIADISTLELRGDGSHGEWIAPAPVPDHALHGASTDFLPNVQMFGRKMRPTGVLELTAFEPGERALVGWIYGGIDANFPLPLIPGQGTQATNALYAVYLRKTPWDGIPASAAHEAVGITLAS